MPNPSHTPSLIRPDPNLDSNAKTDPLPTTFEPLHSLARTQTILFRVHAAQSISPLIWTGDPTTSGFSSPNANLGLLSPASYSATFQSTGPGQGQDRSDGAWVRHSMVDHINEKSKTTCLTILSTIDERPATPEDDKSPWISTSRSLTWCIWEIARRLSLDLLNPNKPRPDLGHDRGRIQVVELAIINSVDTTSVSVSPVEKIRKGFVNRYRGEMSMSQRGMYEMAMKSCQAAEEVLVYGRIFAEDVKRNLEFTNEMSAQDLPLTLPPQFYTPKTPLRTRTKTKYTQSWLYQLSWDPKEDDFKIACENIVERRRGIEIKLGMKGADLSRVPVG